MNHFPVMMDNINILVAEDFEFNQFVIKQLLSELGSDFVIVSNGQEVLDQLSGRQFDIIFMDIEMPVMDGIEATRIIKSSSSEQIRKIPVIGFTAHKDPGLLEELRNLGFVGFIQKPFKKIDIENIINEHVFSFRDGRGDASSPDSPDNEKKYDVSNLRSFCDGDENFVVQMLRYFVEHTPQVIQNMKQNYQIENWDELRMEAHKFCSELGLLGITEMLSLSESIENGAHLKLKDEKLFSEITRLEETSKQVILQIRSDFTI
ncbi:MAG: hypothetical protein A2W90_17290 [Bacteroidetes bacterium GWF2_42_66]|nr:MAG: hypothetical protein A2W92_21475 [Bacteroidetes bacterium GWA2_42_15]OFX97654.1 MAG: hypothetical protein A2W89_19425 [Bacteroidetes bacterium GWE2_42_39]OFY46902.1 MAG: hypothetical protein A2W90_17290 [Bacteroidetes bacterium GWF2_42_66]HBL75740.1 hypothetical protein [Prolixibacteraceae bacterium]HCR92019.1 hypothetical protein [Prolixibacteraceae bacterium]